MVSGGWSNGEPLVLIPTQHSSATVCSIMGSGWLLLTKCSSKCVEKVLEDLHGTCGYKNLRVLLLHLV